MGTLRTIRDRSFAWVGVVVILISTGALTAFAIIQSNQSNNTSSTSSTTTNPQTCQTDATVSAAPVPTPVVYKPSGKVTSLQITDLSTGSGAAAKAGDCLVMKYYGTLATDGTVFDENFTKPTGFQFPLGQGQVIQGWDQGLVGMKVGGMRRLVIPAALAYGAQSPSPAIPANSDLVFVVKLVSIQNH
jgi:peptidylprolyl isomerase